MLPDRPRLTIAPKHLAILFLPMLVVTASEAILSAFADTGLGMTDVALNKAADIPELVGRYRFLAVFFFYISVCLTIVAIFCAELFSRHSRMSIARVAVGFVLLIGFSMLFSMIEPEWMGSFEAYELVGAHLFEEGLRPGNMGYCQAGYCGEAGGFHALRTMIDVTNLISALSVSAVVLGMIVALARPGPIILTDRAGILAEAATLKEAQKAARRYLYLAGVLLSVGMMLGYAWMHWPAGLIADPGVAADYTQLVEAISMYRGVSYTVLILSFYMPVSLIQMVRIERLHAAAKLQAEKDKAARKAAEKEKAALLAAGQQFPEDDDADELLGIAESVQGFDIERIGSLDAFKAILSILAPILAGLVGSFVGVDILG